jgi:putative phosphonate metabolism protein
MRYAIYFVPTANDPLWSFGTRWLGRDPETGTAYPQETSHAAITKEPRRYGFHATLKPPFALAAGQTAEALFAAAEEFARRHPAFDVARMKLAALGHFLAVVPALEAPGLHALADACVRDFDRFRAPSDAAEFAKRRQKKLTARQDDYLVRWGYPYVFDEFRFHLTLTGPLDPASLAQTQSQLASPVLEAPLAVREIAIFEEPADGAPFTLKRRFSLGSS